MRKRAVLAALAAFICFTGASAAVEMKEKWVIYSANFEDDTSVDRFIRVVEQARAAGCTHVFVDDPQFGFINEMPLHYWNNIKRARAAVEKSGLTVAPGLFPFGYSGAYLHLDPNVAAGLPVKDAPFIVKGGVASPDPKSAPGVANAGFDEADKNGPVGWKIFDPAGKNMDLDKHMKHSGAASLCMGAFNTLPKTANGNCYVTQRLKVKPFQYYRLTFWTLTQNFAAGESGVRFESGGGRRRHCYTNMAIKSDESWAMHEATFNTLEADEINMSVGAWNAAGGTVWFDDLKIEPAGLANVLRTEMKPLTITGADGSVTYVEGKDFRPVVDPKLGKAPVRDAYYRPFPYDVWHKGPSIAFIPGSHVKDGDTVLVSFYHPAVLYDDQVVAALDEPKVFEFMDAQAAGLSKAWGAKNYFMRYNEVRVGGWEVHPDGSKPAPGQILAANVARGVEIIRKYVPDARIYTWSDMFDPKHNAYSFDERKQFYCLVNGNWNGSWEGLPKDVVVMNWNGTDRAAASLKWFAGLGYKQVIAGYYDGNPADNVAHWMTAARGVPDIIVTVP